MTDQAVARLLGLACNPRAPQDVLVRLARHVRAARKMSWQRENLPDPVAIEILAHRDPSAVLHLDRRRVSRAILDRIAADGDEPTRNACRNFVRESIENSGLSDPATRAHVAHFVQLTPELGMNLATARNDEVRGAAARNPTLPAEAVARLVADPDPVVRAIIAQHRLVDAQTRDRLYEQLAEEVKAGSVAAEAALEWNFLEPDWVCEEPLPARLVYLESPHVVFRRALARSRDLPPEAWQRLDVDPDWRVRRYAAMRPDVPPSVLERLVREYGDGGPFRPGLVEHPNFPREVLLSFVDAAEPRVRRLALHDTGLPRPLLVRLVTDPDTHVRRTAAGHSGLDEELLTVLLADEDTDVVANAAANEALPVWWMYQILSAAGL